MSPSSTLHPPTVKVGGKPYQIKFANGAFYLLSSWGIDVTTLTDSINSAFKANQYTSVMYKLAAAALGTMDAAGNWKTAGMTPLEMADALQDGESEAVIDATWKAFTGKLGLATKTAETTPAKDATSGTGENSGPSEPPAAA